MIEIRTTIQITTELNRVIYPSSVSEAELLQLWTKPGVPVIKPISSRFISALDYRRYHLNNISGRIPHTVTGKRSRYSRRLKAHMTMKNFMGRALISNITFLESYKNSCDHSRINEGIAMKIMPYVLEVKRKLTLINYLQQPDISYQRTMNFLLSKKSEQRNDPSNSQRNQKNLATTQPARIRRSPTT